MLGVATVGHGGGPPTDAEYSDEVAYVLHCAGCHKEDGRGADPIVPSLQKSLGRIVQVDGGREYLVRVPGAAQAPVTDRQLAAILNYILIQFNAETLPADFDPLSTAEVTNVRQKDLSDPLSERRRLWERVLVLKPSNL